MDVFTNVPPTTTEKWMARLRRFFRWLSKPQVVLSLTMLLIMFVMVVIPLYRLVETTVTWQAHDLTRVPDAVEGKFTSFHWVRMLTGIFGRIYTYTPLQHSMTIAIGHPAGAFDRRIAGLAGGAHRYAGQETGQSTGGAALHHALLDPGPGLAGAVQEQDHRRSTGNV